MTEAIFDPVTAGIGRAAGSYCRSIPPARRLGYHEFTSATVYQS